MGPAIRLGVCWDWWVGELGRGLLVGVVGYERSCRTRFSGNLGHVAGSV